MEWSLLCLDPLTRPRGRRLTTGDSPTPTGHAHSYPLTPLFPKERVCPQLGQDGCVGGAGLAETRNDGVLLLPWCRLTCVWCVYVCGLGHGEWGHVSDAGRQVRTRGRRQAAATVGQTEKTCRYLMLTCLTCLIYIPTLLSSLLRHRRAFMPLDSQGKACLKWSLLEQPFPAHVKVWIVDSICVWCGGWCVCFQSWLWGCGGGE